MCDTDVSKLYYLNELVHIIRDQTSVVSVSARQAQMANLHISNSRCAGIPQFGNSTEITALFCTRFLLVIQ